MFGRVVFVATLGVAALHPPLQLALDTLTGPHVQEGLVAAIQAAKGPVSIEFNGVSFIDSQGLSALINVRQQFPDRAFRIANPRPNVKRLIEITGLNQTFEIA